MTNFFYYDANGDKIGPVTVAEVKALAQQGVVTPGTMIENAEGRTSVARNIKGLSFPEAVAPKKTTAVPLEPDDSKSLTYELGCWVRQYPWIADRMPQITFALIVVVPLVIGGLLISSLSGKRGNNTPTQSLPVIPNAGKSTSDSDKATKLRVLRDERDTAKRKRDQANRDVELMLEKVAKEEKSIPGAREYPAMKNYANYVNEEKRKADRQVEWLEDKIRDLENDR